MKGVLLCMFLLIATTLEAQFSFTLGTGAASVSMGRTSVCLNGPSAILGNQAVMIESPSFSLTANAARRYNIEGLDVFSIGAIYPTSLGHFGLSIQQYGFKGYKEQKVGLAYARKIAAQTGISIQGNILNLNQFEFGNKSFFSIEIGLYSRLSDRVYLGAHVFAPASRELDSEYGLPSRIRIGPRILIAENTDVFIEMEKVIDQDPIIKTGVAYRMNNVFKVRFGFIPEPSEFSFGFAYSFGQRLGIDGGFLYDQRLGLSPTVGIQYQSTETTETKQ